jgi:serine/threonine-protein kinase
MSPEQMRSSRDVDQRSDIWALGVVLYELLQGMPPFGGDTFSSMVLKVVNDPLPQLTVRLPGDLAQVVYRCLEKDPARRFQNIAELTQALARYAQSETQAAISVQRTSSIIGTTPSRPVIDPGTGQRQVPSTISGAVGARTMPPGRRRWPIFATVGGLLMAVVAVAIVASSGGSGGGGKVDTPAAKAPSDPGTAPAAQTPPAQPPPAQPPAAQPPAQPPAAQSPPTEPAATTPPVAATPPDAAPSTPAATTPDTHAQPAAKTPGTEPVANPPLAKKPKPSKPTTPKETKPQAPTDDDVLGTRK